MDEQDDIMQEYIETNSYQEDGEELTDDDIDFETDYDSYDDED